MRGASGPGGGAYCGAIAPRVQLAVSGPWASRSAIYSQWQVRFGQVALLLASMSSSVN